MSKSIRIQIFSSPALDSPSMFQFKCHYNHCYTNTTRKLQNLTLFDTKVLVTCTHYKQWKTIWKMFCFYKQKMNLISFLPFQLFPLATGKAYPDIWKIGHNPFLAFKGYISVL